MFNNLSTPLTYLATRRSGKPREMVAPGPDAMTLDAILRIAMRTPDHGKLFPWRFVKIEDRAAFARLLEQAFIASTPDARPAQIEAAVSPALMAPALVILLYAPQSSAKIPEWEQQMSVGAVGMNLLHAAHAHGFVASWKPDGPVTTTPCAPRYAKETKRLRACFSSAPPADPSKNAHAPTPTTLFEPGRRFRHLDAP